MSYHLNQKILRTNLVAYKWKNAHSSVQLEMSPTEFGWVLVLKDGRYRMNWYAGEQMPDDVESAIDDSTDYADSNEDIY